MSLYDTDYGWFRPRDEKGAFLPLPEKGRLQEGYGCMECNAYQQGWFVPHDIDGMVRLMGGREKVLADLTDMFEKTPRDYLWNAYYNHANEPVHHVPFLFNRLNEPSLTQKWSRDICRNAYRNEVTGLVGNEDVGQMSAWYVLAASGIYPICPGDLRYEITSPAFDRIEFRLDSKYASGNSFVVEAKDNSPENCKGRTADNDELKYSLRSVEMYAPWIRKIFIVTDEQMPEWLDTSNPQVRVVDLKEIMPPHCLPCFNSSLIEKFIYKIPGLAEKFIYANDDMFINRKVTATDFFTPAGFPIVRLTRKPFRKLRWFWREHIRKKPLKNYSATIALASQLVEDKYGIYFTGNAYGEIRRCCRSCKNF